MVSLLFLLLLPFANIAVIAVVVTNAVFAGGVVPAANVVVVAVFSFSFVGLESGSKSRKTSD